VGAALPVRLTSGENIWQCNPWVQVVYQRSEPKRRLKHPVFYALQVQIDGDGTEAVIASNMENPGKRLIVVEGGQVEAL
jgi:hypothetical protein